MGASDGIKIFIYAIDPEKRLHVTLGAAMVDASNARLSAIDERRALYACIEPTSDRQALDAQMFEVINFFKKLSSL